jgi:AraC-like DNA-binding protein
VATIVANSPLQEISQYHHGLSSGNQASGSQSIRPRSDCGCAPPRFHCWDRRRARQTAKGVFPPAVRNRCSRSEESPPSSTERIGDRGLCGTLYAESLMAALTTRLLYAVRSEKASATTRISPLPPRPFRRVLARMRANLSGNLDLATLAAETGYSRAHFLRTFRATTGQTPHRYQLELRLEKARALIAGSGGVRVLQSCTSDRSISIAVWYVTERISAQSVITLARSLIQGGFTRVGLDRQSSRSTVGRAIPRTPCRDSMYQTHEFPFIG